MKWIKGVTIVSMELHVLREFLRTKSSNEKMSYAQWKLLSDLTGENICIDEGTLFIEH